MYINSRFTINNCLCIKQSEIRKYPCNPSAPVNSASKEFFQSVTVDSTIYYTHMDTIANEELIYRSRLVDGAYQQPEKLGPNVNIGMARYDAFVAPDESYLIIPAYGMPDSYGATDYFISFHDSPDNWSRPVNMGPEINSSFQREWSASVSPDGKYLFFMSDLMGGASLAKLCREALQEFHNSPQNGNTDIYRISCAVIDRLRKNGI